MKNETVVKKIAENRKARHEYYLLERYEAGIVLKGTEVKSLRAGKLNLAEAYAKIENGEIFLYELHISPYEQGNIANHEPKRPRKLLLHKSELRRLANKSQESGWTIVPTRLYFSDGKAKVEIALARGKHEYDKREAIKEEDARRAIQSALKDKRAR